MDADTLSALRDSIKKWEMIIASAGGDDASSNCALCRKFFDDPNFCEGCPVKTCTGLKGCIGSPYDDWARHHEREHSDGDDCRPLTIECGKCQLLAEAQLDFLRGLLPREHVTQGLPAAARFHWWIKRGSGIILDFLHGVDTAPGVSSGEGGHVGIRGAHAYDPAPWWTLNRSLRLVSLRPEDFTFVDFGCGKGRVLLSALAIPFFRIVGIEVSPTLFKIAERNLSAARFIPRRCSSVQVICADASEFLIPDGPNVLFFYNPFPFEVMEIVLRNIVRCYLDAPRPVFLIFYACSSLMPRIREFLLSTTNGCARPRVSTTIGYRSVSLFELPQAQHPGWPENIERQ